MANLLNTPIFVSEQAPLAIETVTFLMKRFATFGLVLFILGFLADHLSASMGELTLLAVTTNAEFYPVFAHLCLVLGLINFAYSASLLRNILCIQVWKFRLVDGGLCCADCATIVGIQW